MHCMVIQILMKVTKVIPTQLMFSFGVIDFAEAMEKGGTAKCQDTNRCRGVRKIEALRTGSYTTLTTAGSSWFRSSKWLIIPQ